MNLLLSGEIFSFKFVYSRYMDIANRYPLYCTEPLSGNNSLGLESYEHVLDYAGFGDSSFKFIKLYFSFEQL